MVSLKAQWRALLSLLSAVAFAAVVLAASPASAEGKTDANDDSVSAAVGDTVHVNVTENDTVSDAVRFVGASMSSCLDGSGLSLKADGSLTGTAHTAGTYTCTYWLFSTSGSYDTATLTVKIDGGPVDPTGTVANNDSATVDFGAGVSLNVTDNDAPSEAVQSVAPAGNCLAGSGLFLRNDGSVGGSATVAGTFTCSYTLNSTSGSSDTAVLTVVVNPAPPTTSTPEQCFGMGERAFVYFNLDDNPHPPRYKYEFFDGDGNRIFEYELADAVTYGEYDGFMTVTFGGGQGHFFPVRSVVVTDTGKEPSEAFPCDIWQASPIALDTDFSGDVERISGEFAFDITGNGEIETLGEWFAPTEGILVNAGMGFESGISGQHLFGDMGGTYADGYEKLALLDANGDGQVAGVEMTDLAIWTDSNSNALLDDGELSALAGHQVVSLSTQHTNFKSSAALADGSTMTTEDLWFPVAGAAGPINTSRIAALGLLGLVVVGFTTMASRRRENSLDDELIELVSSYDMDTKA